MYFVLEDFNGQIKTLLAGICDVERAVWLWLVCVKQPASRWTRARAFTLLCTECQRLKQKVSTCAMAKCVVERALC